MNNFINFITISCLIINCVSLDIIPSENEHISSEIIPDTADLVKLHGKECESHDVITEDGYILKIFRIPGNVSRPIYLAHGALDSSDGWILRGKKSTAITLADSGYDVWLGNHRGNRYSRQHINYNPDIDKEFWDFSIHEMGCYDLPAIIDYILDKTHQQNLVTYGFSQGTAIFYILGSTKQNYNEKVKVLVSLSPIAYIHHTKGLLRFALDIYLILSEVLKSLQYEEIAGFNSILTTVIRAVCSIPKIGYDICANTLIFPTVGSDPENFEPEFLPTFVKHYPSGTSRRTIDHFAQIGFNKRFAQYDFGVRNMEKYNSLVPPEYDLSKVTMDVALYLGRNDFVSTIEDVELLKNNLRRVVAHEILQYDLWNHLDHVYARNMTNCLFPSVLDLLKEYN